MGLVVPNEAERSPKLELEMLSGWREGRNAAGELSHGWEKAWKEESSVRRGKPVGRGSRKCWA